MKPMRLIALVVFAVSVARPARAVQPLEQFVAAARRRNPDALEARANLDQAKARTGAALGRELPGLSARGSYTRNQYETRLTLPGAAPTVLVPRNSWDGVAFLSVPIVDLAGWQRVAAANTSERGVALQLLATRLQIEARTTQDYYQLLANVALVEASETAVKVAQESLKLALARQRAGTATALDVDRARAELQQRLQQLASARLEATLSARALETDSGIAPDLTAAGTLTDDLHVEPPVEEDASRVPSFAAARAAAEAAGQEAQAQRLSLLPSIAGQFGESGTSEPGFVGHDWTWQAGVTATWNFDLTSLANIRGADAAADAARAREERAHLAARDEIHRQWNTVFADIERSKAARVGRDASVHAAQMAARSYEAGTLAQLDLLQALRDAFTAEVARIQADADLLNARAQLRLATGRSLLAQDGVGR